MSSPGHRRAPARMIAALAAVASLAGVTASCGDGGGGSEAAEPPATTSGGPTTSASSTTGPAVTATVPPSTLGEPLVEDDFDRPDGVVTDERTWHDDTGTSPPDDDIWAATSGVLQVTDGVAWSDSPVFRMVTHRRDLGDVAVSFRLRIDSLLGDERHVEEAWDGVHLLLHYQDETELYAVSVSRRDGSLAIKRKDPGGPSNGGTYSTLASGPGAVPVGRWADVRVTIRQVDLGVHIGVELDGRLVLDTTDTDTVGVRRSRPGRVGVRADNTVFHLDDLVVARIDLEPG